MAIGTTGTVNANKSYEVTPAPNDSISSLSFSPKGNLLVATSWDNEVRCWNINAGSSQAKASIRHEQPVWLINEHITKLIILFGKKKHYKVLCSTWKDDSTVFSGGCDKIVKMWSVDGGQPTVVAAHDAPIKEVAWVQQKGGILVTGSWDKTVRFWDPRQQQPILTVQLPERCYALSVNYPLMVVGTADRNLVVYDLDNPQKEFKRIQSPLKYQTRCVAAFPDKQGFMVGSIEGRVGVQHLLEGQQDKNFTYKCHRDGSEIYAVNALNFHPVYHTFASSGSDGGFNFWDKDSKQRLKAMNRCDNPIPCSTFNHDGSLFAYAVCYEWSKGAEKHNPTTAKPHIYLHTPPEADVKPKLRSSGKK